MGNTHVAIDTNGQLFLTDGAKAKLGVPSGGEVEVIVRERCIGLRPKRKPFSQEDLDREVAEIRKAFARKPAEPSLEDELDTMRREKEEHAPRKYGC